MGEIDQADGGSDSAQKDIFEIQAAERVLHQCENMLLSGPDSRPLKILLSVRTTCRIPFTWVSADSEF
jgi:hypothetical protein